MNRDLLTIAEEEETFLTLPPCYLEKNSINGPRSTQTTPTQITAHPVFSERPSPNVPGRRQLQGQTTEEKELNFHVMCFQRSLTLLNSTDCQLACKGQGGTGVTHSQQTPEMLKATVPETAHTNIPVTETSLSHQLVTELSPTQTRVRNSHTSPNAHLTKAPFHRVAETGDLSNSNSHSQHSVCRQNHPIPTELESNDQGPLDPSNSVRGMDTIYHSQQPPCR